MLRYSQENLVRALSEFKRDKINRQNARLSLVNSVYENPSMPRRKIMLSVGANNYRPPMERSKSAPKLMAIEEAVGEEDEETGSEESRRSCCKVDPIFPAMTLGRRHCRRGHSMRRSRLAAHLLAMKKNGLALRERSKSVSFNDCNNTIINDCDVFESRRNSAKQMEPLVERRTSQDDVKRSSATSQQSTIGSNAMDDTESDEDFNHLLMDNEYDCKSSLTGELMSYFDTTMKMKTAASLCDLSPIQYDGEVCMATNMTLIGHRASVSLDDLDTLTDDEAEQYERHHCGINGDNSAFFNQNSIIDCLVNASVGDEQTTDSSSGTIRDRFDASGSFRDRSTPQLDDSFGKSNELVLMRNAGHSASFKAPRGIVALDSDEGSISSGCETSSNVTATNGDSCDKSANDDSSIVTLFASKNGRPATIKRVDSQNKHANKNSNHAANKTDGKENINNNGNIAAALNGNSNEDDCDSEYSDESGFVEYQNVMMVGHHNSGFQATEMPNIDEKHDTNNNSNTNGNEFDGGDKVPARLLINIPKNAKSILI